jgi:hypothetical protein
MLRVQHGHMIKRAAGGKRQVSSYVAMALADYRQRENPARTH